MDYARLLKKGFKACNEDVTVFKMWEDCIIDTKECFGRFILNNDKVEAYMDGLIKYDEADFEHWLNSLGYKRGIL